MTIQEASIESRYSAYMLREFCKGGEFVATKPRGRRGGWEINKASFMMWFDKRRTVRSNAAAREIRRKNETA